MRIIRQETPEEIEVKCTGYGNGAGGCGVVLGIVLQDIYRTQSHARDESTDYATICCPQCSALTDLPDKKIPSGWTAWEKRKPLTPENIIKAARAQAGSAADSSTK